MNSSDDEILELFSPQLSEENERRFQALISQIDDAFPARRAQVVQWALDAYLGDENDIESMKYITVLHVLIDLAQQGWELEVHEGKLYLKMSVEHSTDKDYIRYRLSSERRAQFQEESVRQFIESMEEERPFNGMKISIKNLIGDPQVLIRRIQEHNDPIVLPYIQAVTRAKDTYTGYWLSDIWRYFRYTWSIPYKTMPGRNLFYLVRDEAQPLHPVIGIFALGNSVLNLTVRDDEIGWTVEAIAQQLQRKQEIIYSKQQVSGTLGKTVIAKNCRYLETEAEYKERVDDYALKTMNALLKNLKQAIDDLYVRDLDYHRGTKYPTQEKVDELRRLAEDLQELAIDNKKTSLADTSFEQEAQEPLFKKKRAGELARLLEAKRVFNRYKKDNLLEWLSLLMHTDEGRKAVNVALVANRKTKIGSNMMEIIVCGAIPPYNELLGGKLVSILACSPRVIRDCTEKYKKQVSEIASRMKGKRVIRDSRLAFLGTTSLYSIGSSQYNRIKVPISDDYSLQYKKMGITEGYGTVYFSKKTTTSMMRILELQDGGRRINNIFGEGTSPRFRLISRGLSSIGIRSNAFLRHYSPRIVYSIELAKNTNDFLCGVTEDLDYPFDIHNQNQVERMTQELIDYWYQRWLTRRLDSVDLVSRLQAFEKSDILVSTTR